ncbi:MAG TPA: hypothetical protein VL400_05580 [Polyangiaceae bacterium]|jgi:hypothetical protein|nr:hypothetical protein [Polyangiaceae bacterium]
MFLRLRALLALLACMPAALIACGDSGTTSTGGTGGSGGAWLPAECTLITQASDTSTYFSVDAVGFPFEPATGGPGADVVIVSPNFKGAFGPGTYELTGVDGDVTVYAIEDAVTMLIGHDPSAMDGRDFGATAGTVKFEETPSYGTQFQGRVKGSLSHVVFRELDASFEVVDGGECWGLESATFDASGPDASCEAPADPATAPSGGACLADFEAQGHDCNPVTNEGCMAGETCDLSGNFKCLPLTGTEAAVCGACDNFNDQFCGVGLTCDSYSDTGKCFRYCCTDADCGSGNTCVAYYALGVGVCMSGVAGG